MIGISGTITTISFWAWNTIKTGAKATGKLAKAVYNLGKKLSPLLIPLFNMLATVLFWGAKTLSWLASNLWLLVLAFTHFLYDQYKNEKRSRMYVIIYEPEDK